MGEKGGALLLKFHGVNLTKMALFVLKRRQKLTIQSPTLQETAKIIQLHIRTTAEALVGKTLWGGGGKNIGVIGGIQLMNEIIFLN